MADVKISALPGLASPASADLMVGVDVSDTTASPEGTTKRFTAQSLVDLVEAAAEGVTRVLRLEAGAHVDHGRFWPEGELGDDDLGPFLWDSWSAHLGGEYRISDGYGGAHALLWGYSGDAGSTTGNVLGGTGTHSFGGVYVPATGEWTHDAVGWDGDRIVVYTNGLPDGMSAFPGPRVAVDWAAGGGGHLYVGGSDHSNGFYDLAFIRGFEGVNPLGGVAPFLPERHPSRITRGDSVPCAFFCAYTDSRDGVTFADTSPRGYDTYGDGLPVFHHGRGNNQVEQGNGDAYATNRSTGTQPILVADSTCPFGRVLGESPAPTETARTPATPIVGSLVDDSFERANQTLAFQVAPTLGSTEAGSLGPLPWQYGRLSGQAAMGYFGILGGDAVCTADGTVLAYVPTGTADHDARAERSMASRHCGETSVAFRVVDADNFWVAYYSAIEFFATHGAARTSGTVYYLKVVAGIPGTPTGLAVTADDWTHLRVRCLGNQITIYKGNGLESWTQLGQFTDATHNTGQGAGISNLNTYLNTVNALARWKRFTVLASS